ncbi:MAG: ABC transporter ATP-binding protein, partial [Mobilicoccus sp.]|nr:ABC transporter ATP-binding protein [Mobilicoccus sp.]
MTESKQQAAGTGTDLQERPLIEVEDLSKHFVSTSGLVRRTETRVRAVENVTLAIRPGETVGLVGESGCGKSTLGRCVLRVEKPTSGSIRYRDGDIDLDVAQAAESALGEYRRQVRLVFQDPFASLNPRMTIREIVGEPLRGLSSSERRDEVVRLLEQVGLRRDHLDRYPHAFSGGERQRISIARAIATDPRLVVADEAVSALDVSVRAQVLNLFGDLRDDMGLAYLFISHDLSTVEYLSDRVAVMYLGRIVEIAPAEALFDQPLHPYTESLLSAVPQPDPRLQRSREVIKVQGELPDPTAVPDGCPFRTRCLYAEDQCADPP